MNIRWTKTDVHSWPVRVRDEKKYNKHLLLPVVVKLVTLSVAGRWHGLGSANEKSLTLHKNINLIIINLFEILYAYTNYWYNFCCEKGFHSNYHSWPLYWTSETFWGVTDTWDLATDVMCIVVIIKTSSE